MSFGSSVRSSRLSLYSLSKWQWQLTDVMDKVSKHSIVNGEMSEILFQILGSVWALMWMSMYGDNRFVIFITVNCCDTNITKRLHVTANLILPYCLFIAVLPCKSDGESACLRVTVNPVFEATVSEATRLEGHCTCSQTFGFLQPLFSQMWLQHKLEWANA